MLCPKCNRENLPTSRFCVFCGAPLLETEEPKAEGSGEMAALREEVRHLRDLVIVMNGRLVDLESKQGITAPPPPEPVPVAPIQEVAPPVVVRAPEPKAEPPRAKPPKARRGEWEQILGGSWLARVGVLALIIGIGFFLKFAFDNNWLGPTGRGILGVIIGLAMLGAGYWWRKRYPILTQVFSGGGIAVLYLSIFASFAIYDIVHFYVAFAFLFLVSIVSAILALRYNSMSLAILGIIGAFIAPFILGAFGGSGSAAGGAGQAVQLLAYVILVDIGVLILSSFRNWRWFTLLALGCSLIAFGVWHSEFERDISLATAEIGITIIFLIFAGATTLFHIIWRRAPQAFDFTLMMINATAYFGISLGLMWDAYRAWMGGFVFLIALFFGAVSYLAFKRRAEGNRLGLFALGIALVFLTIALPIHLGDKAWTTIAWSAEGAVLMWLAFKAKIPVFRYYSYLVFSAVVIRLLFFDTPVHLRTFQPIFNERFLAFIFAIAAMCLTSYLLWRNRDQKFRINHLVFLGAADFLTLWIIGAEVLSYSSETMTVSASLSLLILLALAGVTILYHLAWRRGPRAFDLFLTLFNAAAFIIISLFIWGELRAWMGSLYFLLAIFYGILGYSMARRGTGSARLSCFSSAVALVFLTVAIPVQLGDTAWTTIAWAAEGAVLVWLSYTYRLPQLRWYSWVAFSLMAIRLLFFDTPVNLRTFQPVLNERFLAFAVSIAALYVAGYFMLRESRLSGISKAGASVILIAANFFTIWLLSFEVWGSFSNALRAAEAPVKEGLRSAQNLSLTAVWAFYAVIGLVIGIVKRWRYVRLGALVLLVIAICKVFVFDVFKLEMGYRIGAFVGLGILLLVSAYLYQRYSKIIKGVFIEK
ncbi:MAG: DUF2339 domain-containing protein [Deltaproteobacteria bacterium]|nr:DUF2339 domain-containing protein [Deltaproteobacteria bacterium]